MNKLILVLIFGMLLFPLVSSAQESLGTFKQGENIVLRQTCANCSFNNITSIVSPNSTLLIGQVAMTKVGNEYTYILTENYTIEQGKYIVNGFGDSNGINTLWIYDFLISTSGRGGTDNIVLFIFIILAIYALNLFGFFGKNEILTILGGMALMFLGVYIIANGITIYRDNLTNYFAYVTMGWGFISTFWASYSLYEEM